MTRMKTIILNTISTDIELAVNMYTEATKPMKLKTNKTQFKLKQPNQWDENCEKLKKNKYIKLRQFRFNSTPENLNIYKAYKTILNRIFS